MNERCKWCNGWLMGNERRGEVCNDCLDRKTRCEDCGLPLAEHADGCPTGVTAAQVEEAARREYESLPNADCRPSWDELPDTARLAHERFGERYAGAHNYRELIELFARDYYRDQLRHAGRYLVPRGYRIVKA